VKYHEYKNLNYSLHSLYTGPSPDKLHFNLSQHGFYLNST